MWESSQLRPKASFREEDLSGLANWQLASISDRMPRAISMSVSKLRIAIRVVLGVTLGIVVLYAFAIYSLNRNMKKAFGPEFQQDMQDFVVALKGTAGEALFEHGTIIPIKANMPVGADAIEQGKSLVAAYRKDPEKFKKYSDLLETALNAFAVGDAIRQLPASATLPSDSLGLTSVGVVQRVDAWGNPFCLLVSGNRLAIVSLGHEPKTPASCRNLTTPKKEIFSAPRKLFEHPSGEVVLIIDRNSEKRSSEQAMQKP
jgi:hypothetical protein